MLQRIIISLPRVEKGAPLGMDALAHKWTKVLLYAFPPKALIPALLERVRRDKHKVILIVPHLPDQV